MAHPAPPRALTLFLLLLFTASIQAAQGASTSSHPSPPGYVPVRAVVYRSVERTATTAAAGDDGGGGGRYAPFQLCMGCRCCAAASSNASSSSSCVDTRCCYAIDCNVPGKPFGVCAFSPRACGCGGDDADTDTGDEGNSCTTNH